MLNYIVNGINNDEFVIGIFLDIRKAFDCINHSMLIDKLENIGIRGNVLAWFVDYLSNRVQKVKVNNVWSTNAGLLDIGVLQGSIIGVLLFLIYINDLPTSTLMRTLMFADDSTCLDKHRNLNDLETSVNLELSKIADWFIANKMSINSDKTKYMIFHPRYKAITYDMNITFKDQTDPSITVALERITNNSVPDNFIRSLGVLLDENLSFDKHINTLALKLNRALFYLNRSKNILGFNARKQLYFSLIHSNLLYCNTIYGSSSSKNIKRIHVIQKKAIRIVFNKDFRAHTTKLFYKLKLLPLPDLINFKSLIFFYDFKSKNLPATFNNEWILNSERNNLFQLNLRSSQGFYIPVARYQYLTNFPLIKGPKLWNSLRADFKYSLIRYEFIRQLKNLCLEKLINPQYVAPTSLMDLYNLVE